MCLSINYPCQKVPLNFRDCQTTLSLERGKLFFPQSLKTEFGTSTYFLFIYDYDDDYDY